MLSTDYLQLTTDNEQLKDTSKYQLIVKRTHFENPKILIQLTVNYQLSTVN
jgi:hypothetical protein